MIVLAVFAAFSVGLLVGAVLMGRRVDRDWHRAHEAAIAEMTPHVPDPRDRELLDTFEGLVEKHLAE